MNTPKAKATKVTAEHLWSKNAKVTPQKAHLFDGAKNTADKVDGATNTGWSPTA